MSKTHTHFHLLCPMPTILHQMSDEIAKNVMWSMQCGYLYSTRRMFPRRHVTCPVAPMKHLSGTVRTSRSTEAPISHHINFESICVYFPPECMIYVSSNFPGFTKMYLLKDLSYTGVWLCRELGCFFLYPTAYISRPDFLRLSSIIKTALMPCFCDVILKILINMLEGFVLVFCSRVFS